VNYEPPFLLSGVHNSRAFAEIAVVRDRGNANAEAHPAVPGWSICSMKVHAPAISVGREEIWGGWGSIAERVSD